MLELRFKTQLGLRIFLTILHAIAIGLTLFRCFYRMRVQRLWWDDYVASIAVLVNCGYLSSLWFSHAGSHPQTLPALLARYWTKIIFFFVVVWCTRISIALAIARIFPPRHNTRRFMIGVAYLFTTISIACIIQASVVCSGRNAMVIMGGLAECRWNASMRVMVTTSSVFADFLLTATVLYKYWRAGLPRKQRRLLLAGFVASTMAIVSIIGSAVFRFAPDFWEPARYYLRCKSRHFEAALSLIACNLLVLFPPFYQYFWQSEDLEPTVLDLTYFCDTSPAQPRLQIQSNPIPTPPAHGSTPSLVLTEITDAYTYADSPPFASERSFSTSTSMTTSSGSVGPTPM